MATQILDDKEYNFNEQKKSVNNFTWDYVRNIYFNSILNI